MKKAWWKTKERTFRNLFKQTPEMVCILIGPEHRFEFVNDAHIKALGFDATGMKVREAQPESVEIHGILDNVYRTGITAELRQIPITLTDRLRYFDLTYAARRDENGEINGVMILGVEITEQFLLKQQIIKNEEQLTLAINVSKIGFYDWDVKKDSFSLSEQFYRDWDINPNETGLSLEKLMERIYPEDYIKTKQLVDESLKSKKDFRAEYRVIKKDGTFIWIEARGKVIYDEDNYPVRFFGTTQDITARKTIEHEIHESRVKAESASEAKTSFLANMSHEIRTPLGAILGFANLLKEPNLEQSQQLEYLNIIDRNGQALSKIIDDILDLSKVEAGRLELEKVEFKVRDLLESVIEIFENIARKKHIKLSSTVNVNVPKVMISDPARIRQILVNLVGNAVKFTREGEVLVSVDTFTNEEEKTHLRFSVKDTGMGITVEQQERLFNVFHQADGSMTRKYGGSGLGLALSRRFARALGGDVHIEQSQPNKGSTFIASVEAKAAPDSTQETEEKESSKPTPSPDAPMRVLVVEDSVDNQFLLKHILTRAGFILEFANHGEEAIEMVNKNDNYDVILMDMQMPVLDGYSATRALRADGYTKPIIALTAHAMQEEKARILEAGCDEHMTKPLDNKLLIATILSYKKN